MPSRTAQIKSRAATSAVTKAVHTTANRWLAFFFCVSGVLALIYEVVWQRQFALVFGSAAPATAAVLSAYFAGLGLGAWWVGNRVNRWTRPLRAYAVLECCIGLGAVLVVPLLRVFDAIYPHLFQLLDGRPSGLLLIRGVAALIALLLPTFCMGGTLPLLGALVDQGRKHLGLTAGWLYFVNTAGAALGALAVPFFLLPRFGLLHAVWGCAVVNLLLACGAWFLDTRKPIDLAKPNISVSERPKIRPKEKTVALKTSSVGWLAFASGFATFALQIFWNRAFAQLHENSMYSFAVVVSVTIAALAIGTLLARRALRRQVPALRLLSNAWMAGGMIVAISPWVFIHVSDHFAYLTTGAGWYAEAGRLVALAFGLLLLPMALVGIGFPALMECVGQSESSNAGKALGRIFSINVVGSICGSLVSAFCLPHWLGLWNSLVALGLALVAVGLIVRTRRTDSEMYSWSSYAIGAIVAVAVSLAGWLNLPRVSVERAAGEKLLSVREGAHGITAVVERPGSRRLKLNNHYGLGGTASTGDERMQTHIPLLLHPAPHRVAFLGLGTGITAGGALFHPVENLTIIELVPEVIASAREYFSEANQRVIENERTRVVADDARHALRNEKAHYDVIVGDLVVPWRQGEGSLFTLEQFHAARNALSPHGIFCQWLPLFQLSPTEVNIICRTFLEVFPRAQVWRGDFSPTEPAIALVGSSEPIAFDDAVLRQRLTQMRADPTNPQLQFAENFWMNYIGELDASQIPSSEPRLNLDDQPWVEILGPLLHTGGNEGNLFVGRALQKWERAVAENSKATLTSLSVADRAAVEAGDALAEMTLCLSEQNPAGAKLAQSKLRALLPENAYRQLF